MITIDMKLESESIFFHSTLSHKPTSKAPELVNEEERLKTQNEENLDEFSRALDDYEQYTTKDGMFLSPFKEDLSSGHRMDNYNVEIFNVESFEKDSEVYVEENVPESEENSCNIIKDICMDEGTIPSALPVRVISESDNREDLQIIDIGMTTELENSDQSLSEKDLIDELDVTAMADLNTNQTEELESCNGNCNGKDGVEEDTLQVSSEIEILANSSLVSAREEASNEADLYPVSILEEPGDDSVPNDLSYDSKVESESITFDFSSLVPDSNEESKFPENGADPDGRSKSEFGNLSKAEDDTSSQIQPGIGESSFSSVGPSASVMNFSGPAANSGSLSIRSDGSATSTRSFAFPILQGDWHHSSPVRMGKADQRFLRKDRGWRHGLFCCRF